MKTMTTKISGETTLSGLEAEAREQGVTFISVKLDSPVQFPRKLIVGLQTNYGENFVLGDGETIQQALDNAFEELAKLKSDGKEVR